MFYYVQRSNEPIIKEFHPRIPNSRMEGENGKLKRICLAKTIEGCVNAAPWGYSQIDYRHEFEVFRLYSFDEKKIPVNNILDTRAIYNCGYVDDAVFTKEVWIINQNLIPDSISYFQIGNYEEETVEIVPYKCKKKNLMQPYFCLIRNVEFIFIPEEELFQGRKFHAENFVEEYRMNNVLPKEVSFEYLNDNIIYFSEPVVFAPRDLENVYE